MITGSPSCATHDAWPAWRHADNWVGDTWMGACPTCGHELLETKAIELFDERPNRSLMLTAEDGAEPGDDLDDEARRFTEVARLTAKRHREQRARRRATRRGWSRLDQSIHKAGEMSPPIEQVGPRVKREDIKFEEAEAGGARSSRQQVAQPVVQAAENEGRAAQGAAGEG